MDVELEPSTASDPSSPPTNPIRKIGDTLNHDSLKNNHWHNSFNTIHTHHHYPVNSRGYPRYRRIVSTLPSTPEEQSRNPLVAGQGFPSPPSRESIEVRTNKSINQQSENTRPAISNHVSEGSIYQAPSSQVQHRRSKSQSLLSRLTQITRSFNRTTVKERLQPKLYIDVDAENVAKYLPKGIDEKYKNYICSPHLDDSTAIPVFDPSTAWGEGVRRRVRIDVGDVGTFTMHGGFQVAFNILLDGETNDLCGYDVPKNFSPFVPRGNSEQNQKCFIKDDGEVIDLDKCGSILKVPFNYRDAPLHGIKQTPLQFSQDRPSPLFEISPLASHDNKRGYIHFPSRAVARRYMFSMKAWTDLTLYLNEQLPNWLEHLDKLREQQKALPIILTSVWAARSFACAAYKSNPNTSATLQLKAVSEEKLEWTHAPEGCVTMLAPVADGYDEHDRLISEVPNQSFAIQGYGLLKKELKKSRAG